MTNEYNETLTSYLLGKLPKENGVNEILPPNIEEINNNLEEFIRKYYQDLTIGWSISNLLTRGDYIILWCNDYNNDIDSPAYGRWEKSFVLVLDKNYNPLKYIDKFDSGTPLTSLYKIASNDNGKGSIYGIDTIFKENSLTVDRTRLVIINDFTLTDFNIKLLNSYNIPNYNNTRITPFELIKSETEGKYFLLYRYNYNSGFKGGALEFVNNVGTANEWNFYPYTGNKEVTWNGFEVAFPVWNENGLEFKIFTDYTTDEYNGNTCALVILKSKNDGETKECVDDISTNFPNQCKNIGQVSDVVSNNNTVLLTTDTTYSDKSKTQYLIEFKLTDLSYKIWYSKENYIYEIIENGYISNGDIFNLFVVNNQYYYFKRYYYNKATHDADYNFTYEYYDNKLYMGQIYEENLKEFFIKDYDQNNQTNFKSLTFNVFNLYEFGLIHDNFVIKLSQVYNTLKYNGQPYINTNALISDSVKIYSNNSLVFARNLYNKTLNANSTISTVEIPNTYLNDIDLTSKNLLSETNLTLVENTDTLRKNIYETLYLNFINSIQILDKNTDTNVFNETGSIYLNNSINNAEAYENTKFSNKIKIIYEDNSEKQIGYEINMITNTSVDIKFSLYVDKLMREAQIISNDKTTIYHTINLENLEVDKYYNIKQNMEVGKNGINYL